MQEEGNRVLPAGGQCMVPSPRRNPAREAQVFPTNVAGCFPKIGSAAAGTTAAAAVTQALGQAGGLGQAACPRAPWWVGCATV
jgi:hypothetical protein